MGKTYEKLQTLINIFFFCYSDEAEGALGRDKLEGDATKDSVGRHAVGQRAVRSQAAGSGRMVDTHASQAGEDGTGGGHGRRSGSTAERSKGKGDFATCLNPMEYCVC